MVTRRRLALAECSPSSSPGRSSGKKSRCEAAANRKTKRGDSDSVDQSPPSKVIRMESHADGFHDTMQNSGYNSKTSCFNSKSFYSGKKDKMPYLNPLERKQLSVESPGEIANRKSVKSPMKKPKADEKIKLIKSENPLKGVMHRKSPRKCALISKGILTTDQVLNLMDRNSPVKKATDTYSDEETCRDSEVSSDFEQVSPNPGTDFDQIRDNPNPGTDFGQASNSTISQGDILQINHQVEVVTERKFFKSKERRRSVDNSAIIISKGFNLKFTPKNLKKRKTKQSLSTGKKSRKMQHHSSRKTPVFRPLTFVSDPKTSLSTRKSSADKSGLVTPRRSPRKLPRSGNLGNMETMMSNRVSPRRSPCKNPNMSPRRSPRKNPHMSPRRSPRKNPHMSPRRSPHKNPHRSDSVDKPFLRSPGKNPGIDDSMDTFTLRRSPGKTLLQNTDTVRATVTMATQGKRSSPRKGSILTEKKSLNMIQAKSPLKQSAFSTQSVTESAEPTRKSLTRFTSHAVKPPVKNPESMVIGFMGKGTPVDSGVSSVGSGDDMFGFAEYLSDEEKNITMATDEADERESEDTESLCLLSEVDSDDLGPVLVREDPAANTSQTDSPVAITPIATKPAPTRPVAKLFPIFTPQSSPMAGAVPKFDSNQGNGSRSVSPLSPKQTYKKWTPSSASPRLTRLVKEKDGREQLIIDAGQKRVGATQCATCGMVYSVGEPHDEATHARFHQRLPVVLKFQGWKKERVVQEYEDGSRVLLILPEDTYALKKITAVKSIVDEELGYVESAASVKSSSKTFLHVSPERKITGFCLAEVISKGYRVIEDMNNSEEVYLEEKRRPFCCSVEPETARCGVNRIWVFRNARRRGIASRLLDCVRMNFVEGYPLTFGELAFSDPTPEGKMLAAKYTQTPNFLVYKLN